MGLASNDRSIARFTMAGHALVHWFETAIPILLVVWVVQFDVSLAMVGLVVALGYAPFGLGALPGGILADRYGPKRLILACLLGMSASFVLVAGGGVLDSLGLVAVGLVCWGIAASVYHPAGLALISTGVDERGTVFAWHGIAGNAGIALGPFAAATLLVVFGWDDWGYVAAVLAVPGVLAALYGWRAAFDATAAVDVEEATEPISLGDLVANSRALFASAFALVFLIVTVEGLYYRGMLTYLPEVLHAAPAVADVGLFPALEQYDIDAGFYVYVGLLVVGMAGQYVGGKLTDVVSPARGLTLLFGVLCVLALAFVPALSMGLVAVLVCCGLLGFFLFAIQPFYQNAVAVYTPPEGRGLSYGYTYLGEFGLGATSIAIGGVALGVSQRWFFLTVAGFAVIGVVLSGVLMLERGRWLWDRSSQARATNR